jgi:hypothetical protein
MIPRIIAISVALAAVAAVPVLWAADSSAGSKPPTPTTEATSPSANATPKLITFDFRGGTVAELLTGNSISSNATVNVLNPNGIDIIGAKVSNEPKVDPATVVPPFSMRNATPDDLVRAFNAAMAPYGLRLTTNGSDFLLTMTRLPEPSSSDSAAAKPPQFPKATVRPFANGDARVFTVDFPGGTVTNLLAAIAKTGASFNVVGEKADLMTEIPPFSVRNVTSEILAPALNQLFSPRGLFLGNTSNYGDQIYLLTKKRPDQPSRTSFFNSYQLTPYLEQQSIDDIVDAIQTAWALDPANKTASPQLKYHPATSLLFVYGSPEALGTAQQVISSLKRGPEAATDAAPSSAGERTRLQKVSEEVLRRRELRQQNSPAQKSAVPLNPPPDPEKK